MAIEISYDDGRIGTVKIDWVSDAAGNATEVITQLYNRKIKQVKTVPGAGVSSYSVSLLDEDLYDWFGGYGASRSTTETEMFFAEKEITLPEQNLTLTVSGTVSGAGKTGTVYIKVE